MTTPPTLDQQIAACVEAGQVAEFAGDWHASQRLAAAAETLRALVPRPIETAPRDSSDILLMTWELERERAEKFGLLAREAQARAARLEAALREVLELPPETSKFSLAVAKDIVRAVLSAQEAPK